MKLGVLTTSYPRWRGDDAGIFVERLVEKLAPHYQEVTVVVPADGTEPSLEQRGAVTISRYRYGVCARGELAFGLGIAPNIRARPALILQIPGLLGGMLWRAGRRLQTADVILANWLFAGVVAGLLFWARRTPYVVVLRGGDIKFLRVFPWLLRRILKNARRVVTVSAALRDEAIAAIPELARSTEVINNGITYTPPTPDNLLRFLTERGLRKGRYLLFCGSIIPRKRIAVLFDILAAGALIDYDLVLCGRIGEAGYHAELVERARILGVADRVRFEGLVDPREISSYLAGAAAYLSAAEFEGRPNGVLEAMLARIVCVLSDIPAHRELVRDNVSGILDALDDSAAVARRLGELLSDRVRYQQMVEMAHAHVAESSWEGCAERYRAALSATSVAAAPNETGERPR